MFSSILIVTWKNLLPVSYRSTARKGSQATKQNALRERVKYLKIRNCNKSTPSVHNLKMLSQPSSVDHQCFLSRKNQNRHLHPLHIHCLHHCYLHHCQHLKTRTNMLPCPTDHRAHSDFTLLFNYSLLGNIGRD